MTTGHRLLCKEFLRFNTVPCRHMPLLAYFWCWEALLAACSPTHSAAARISQFELFELVLLLKVGNRFPVDQFEATASQSTVPSYLLIGSESLVRAAGGSLCARVGRARARIIHSIISIHYFNDNNSYYLYY